MILLSVISSSGFLNNETSKKNSSESASFINGEWTYRSLLNNPDDTISFNDLEFAVARMKLQVTDNAIITGVLDMGDSGNLTMSGKIIYTDEHVSSFELQGTGVAGTGTAGWIYNYSGFIVPQWKQGVNQIDALVGSVVRSVDHGQSKAGVVASFYMVRR
jgi:hypothetical protein